MVVSRMTENGQFLITLNIEELYVLKGYAYDKDGNELIDPCILFESLLEDWFDECARVNKIADNENM